MRETLRSQKAPPPNVVAGRLPKQSLRKRPLLRAKSKRRPPTELLLALYLHRLLLRLVLTPERCPRVKDFLTRGGTCCPLRIGAESGLAHLGQEHIGCAALRSGRRLQPSPFSASPPMPKPIPRRLSLLRRPR